MDISRPPLGMGLPLVHPDVEMRPREHLAAVPATDGWRTSARWMGQRGGPQVELFEGNGPTPMTDPPATLHAYPRREQAGAAGGAAHRPADIRVAQQAS